MPLFTYSRRRAVALFLAAFAAPCISYAPAARAELGIALKRHETKMVKVGKDDERYEYDASITPEEAGRINAFRRRETGIKGPFPKIYAVPGQKGRYVISENGKPEGKDFGRRLVLIEKTGEGYTRLSRTPGAGDAYNLTPTFFAWKKQVVILAEAGAEYSWGLYVYEVSGGRLKDLGNLNVAAPGAENARDATPYAEVMWTRHGPRILFRSDLILDPGGRKERRITRKTVAPLDFRHNGKKFVMHQ